MKTRLGSLLYDFVTLVCIPIWVITLGAMLSDRWLHAPRYMTAVGLAAAAAYPAAVFLSFRWGRNAEQGRGRTFRLICQLTPLVMIGLLLVGCLT